jgi:predicted Zn-dependent protease
MAGYTAIWIGADNDRESGSVDVRSHAVVFSAENQSHEVRFSNLNITAGGNNKELIFFSDKTNPHLSFYTSDKSILKDPFIKQHPDFASQIKVIKNTRRNILISFVSIIAMLVSVMASLFFLKDYFVESLARKVPVEWEQKVGDKLFQAISTQYYFVENDSLKQELLEVAGPLIKEIEKDGIKIEFYFVKDPTINAFALPGGKVIIQTGLIEHAGSWEELLGVVGHELAHLTRRHHIRGMIDNLGLYTIISYLFGDISALSGTLVNMGGDLASLSNSRSFETEADETGLEYLAEAGINPAGLISFFKTLKEESSTKADGYLSFISTHPSTDDRIKHLKRILKNKGTNFKPIPRDFNKYKQIINK